MRANRNSTFELLRIISMLFIILYHLLLYFVYPWSNDILYKIIQIPLHIGVILFILISGYWGIKTSLDGLIKFIIPIFIYYTGINIIYNIYKSHPITLSDFLFISQSPYWFIKTYLYLYLLAPFINKFLEISKLKEQLTFLNILGFITIYMGTINGDIHLSDGKNITNFIFIYIIGHYIHKYQENLNKVSARIYFYIFLLLNLIICSTYFILYKSNIGEFIWNISFKYCSPFLIINAILFFLTISQFKIQSLKINTVATSVFAIYLIHEHYIIRNGIIQPICRHIYENTNSSIILIMKLFLLSIVIMFISLCIDKVISPLWKRIYKINN